MNDRFTDRANKVMQLANQEAQRFNHEYIGTEHILLGLIKEATGVAAAVLGDFRVDLRKIRIEVEKLMRSGPDPSTMGELPQTPRARKVIEYSMEEARNLNHGFVGTEHILLGLLREQDGAAAQVLMGLGLTLEEVREEVLNLLGCDDNGVEKAMETKPLHEIEAELDRAENADKHVGDNVSTDAPIRYSSARLGKETGDVTLTGEPPEEPLVDPLECILERIDFILDPNPWPEVIKAGNEAKSLCRKLIHLAQLSVLVEENKAAISECHCCAPWPTPNAEPQAEAQAAGLAAVEQAIPETETPTDTA